MNSFLKKFLILLIISRIALIILPLLVQILLLPGKTYSWNYWDTPHYIYLATHGYVNVGDPANFIVFMPLYPLILALFNFVKNAEAVGILISTASFAFACVLLYKLLRLDYEEKFVERFLLLLLIFPTSYFFGAPYTESLFVLLFALSFYFGRKSNWGLSGFFSGLAVLTRPFGILFAPAIFFDWRKGKNKKIWQLAAIFLPTLIAIIIYLVINQRIYGNALAFQRILVNNWQKHFAFPWQSIADSWRIALGSGTIFFRVMIGWAEAVSATLLWLLIPYAYKKLRKSYFVYYLLGVIFLSSTSFILSTPRYLLSIPPFFILLTHLTKNKIVYTVWIFISTILLSYLTLSYVTGQWAF